MKAAIGNVKGARREDGKVTRWVGFRVGSQNYALDILRVQEVLAAAEIEPVPGTPPAILGVTNLRGRIVTVVDLRRCLGLGAAMADAPCSVIVAEIEGEPVGLRVDGVAEICSIATAAIKPAPATQGRIPDPLVRGIVSRGGEGGMLTLLDADRLGVVAALPF
ncbi:chemotaxis protein CheW [Nevskia soli]|uniref:chemotaxis protein CheW n=1 Tax=Nevskia soli TaxID=418856 RepID=UPI00068C2C1D|nr:chemotaxis protein CheW [Nevskia soli]